MLRFEVVADGLAQVEYDGDRALWARRTARKATRCVATGESIRPGDLAYGPVGNQLYRGKRIAAHVIDGESS